MKVVKRYGVFETNSSSTHSLIMIGAAEWKGTKDTGKRKKYNALTSKKDKLYMAAGCCEELFRPEEYIMDYDSPSEKRACNRNKRKAKESPDDFLDVNALSQELALEFIFEVYCKLTGNDYTAVKNEIEKKNKSGRACHMKFFDEGALYDERYDYALIYDLFSGSANEIRRNLEWYFSDDNVLLYLEYYQGYGAWDDDEE